MTVVTVVIAMTVVTKKHTYLPTYVIVVTELTVVTVVTLVAKTNFHQKKISTKTYLPKKKSKKKKEKNHKLFSPKKLFF